MNSAKDIRVTSNGTATKLAPAAQEKITPAAKNKN